MARTDGRPNSHIQEKKPSSEANSSLPAVEEWPAAEEGHQRGWRWAAMLWAVVFLFLTALMLFDLLTGLFHV
jgi:hypothetical protein